MSEVVEKADENVVPLFSRPELYPVPSESVLTVDLRDGTVRILKCTLPALLVQLSSPLDKVDYSMLTDFFLVYRNFMSSQKLLDLIQERFQWAIDLRQSDPSSQEKITSEVILVRMFVLVRHWLSNYFAQDFVVDTSLRRQFLQFINGYSPVDRFLDNIIISLKKLWVQNVQIMWEDLENLIVENNVVSRDDWLKWEIEDVPSGSSSETGEGSTKGKRLSFIALQNINNPVLRNESLLSLLHTREKIPLPQQSEDESKKQSTRIKQRTGSMLLFPENASNGLSINEKLTASGVSPEATPKQEREITDPKNSKDNKHILPQLSRVTNVSYMMKDLEYPSTPSVDIFVPPTPAKNIEFILQTSYMETDLPEQSNGSDSTNTVNGNNTNHKGILGLLSKWKLNHQRKPTVNPVQNPPRVENLIKYVFSISSLDNHANPLPDSLSSMFDILSARTIDEVEYLVSVESDLLAKLEAKKLTTEISKLETNEDESQDYSVIDNLNLYKTVSSIANSVISLSKTLNVRTNKSTTHLLSPSTSALERKNIRNSAPMLYSYNNSRYSITNALMGLPNTNDNSSPKRLVFHDPTRNSPTKKAILANNLNNIGEYNGERDSITSIVTYDSAFSDISSSGNILSQHKGSSNIFMESAPTLKRKLNVNDLRRFNFEKSDSTDDRSCSPQNREATETSATSMESDANDNAIQDEYENENEDIASLITAYEESTSEIDTQCQNNAQIRRPTSGRISITRNYSVASPNSLRSILPKSPLILGNEVFIERDKALAANQDIISELEETTSLLLNDNDRKFTVSRGSVCNDSDSQSISTNLLFSSAQASPQKLVIKEVDVIQEKSEHPDVPTPVLCKQPISKLSETPSIKSIGSRDSEESFDLTSIASKPNRAQSTTLREKYHLEKQATNDIFEEDVENLNPENNKYLFSPDTDSIDFASPEKNLDDLKQQFIDQSTDEQTSLDEEEIATQDNENKDHGIDKKKLEDIMNGIDDTADTSMDPVNLALMKLEGTYDKGEKEIDDKSPSINSELAREVENFQIVQTAALPESARKRQSMFIQRRRNTMIDFSVRDSLIDKDSSCTRLENTDEQIRNLLNQYTLTDSRLKIDNLEQHIPFILMYDSKSVANQLTLIEKEILSEVDWKDLLDLTMSEQLPQFTSWLQLLVQNENLSGIDLAIARFNLTVDWIISEIVMTQDIRLRRNTIQRFIHIAEHCKELQNYNTLMEIILALNSIVVQKFTETWRLVEPGDLLTWETLKAIPSLEKNYSNIRQLIDEVEPLSGCIPFIVVYLSDLSLNIEKRTWIVHDEVLNYNKFQTNVQIVKNFVQKMQWSKFYNIDIDHELLSKCVYITSLSHDEINSISHKSPI
ncbi:mitotic regulator LTE1 [Kluyveromyces lactis]|uniref:Guanine nucleotide exchange factor LTE1 n=1 Tax=Kluyveromyces lactis (strain ATCC 8585 / CBS 2359 / DSM 70799 / NBRC 1267 / NRRL Y-1140 / WM37) TaxID=284590 RepID=LTE1_KLULA|nr:uncharacterized protein KLLA0_A04059g [Kluyveromyces lactis]Q6CY10.1 RecName: Full=Guanine nucleotide exchange factor LTE1 [Kluyveromyces lactis NRRL Y-1140]CAH02767.1 KLLA0A04059p [Kluyveromyces lactis]|eukprot:XP_451179.1 uncharacterized protein KLLA0_A04059g [Kluyveromyces lactis]